MKLNEFLPRRTKAAPVALDDRDVAILRSLKRAEDQSRSKGLDVGLLIGVVVPNEYVAIDRLARLKREGVIWSEGYLASVHIKNATVHFTRKGRKLYGRKIRGA